MSTGPYVYDPQQKQFVARTPQGEKPLPGRSSPKIVSDPRPKPKPNREKVFFWVMILAMGLLWLVFVFIGRERLAAVPAPPERKPVLEQLEEAAAEAGPLAPQKKPQR